MILKHSISINRTASFYSLGNIKNAKTIWFVLHGYGMLGKYFIKKFEPILNKENAIIAPEGLSKFYTKGFYGRVGASWMTKEDRENEIIDCTNYLNQLYFSILENKNDIKVNLLGFSQGGATVARWASNGLVKPNNLILWSSNFPEELIQHHNIKCNNNFILYGNKDEFATNERVLKQQELLLKTGLNFKIIEFEGKHDIINEVLIKQALKNQWN